MGFLLPEEGKRALVELVGRVDVGACDLVVLVVVFFKVGVFYLLVWLSVVAFWMVIVMFCMLNRWVSVKI
ncbi:hypothetical protein AAHH78_39660, partial [Burkholderia pseudomallei]